MRAKIWFAFAMAPSTAVFGNTELGQQPGKIS
jgi:hypothetical protein